MDSRPREFCTNFCKKGSRCERVCQEVGYPVDRCVSRIQLACGLARVYYFFAYTSDEENGKTTWIILALQPSNSCEVGHSQCESSNTRPMRVHLSFFVHSATLNSGSLALPVIPSDTLAKLRLKPSSLRHSDAGFLLLCYQHQVSSIVHLALPCFYVYYKT